jgi:hypothetical protein
MIACETSLMTVPCLAAEEVNHVSALVADYVKAERLRARCLFGRAA